MHLWKLDTNHPFCQVFTLFVIAATHNLIIYLNLLVNIFIYNYFNFIINFKKKTYLISFLKYAMLKITKYHRKMINYLRNCRRNTFRKYSFYLLMPILFINIIFIITIKIIYLFVVIYAFLVTI